MPIRLGSNEYFADRAASTQHINEIGAGNSKGKLKGFDKFCAKISYFFRKYLLPGDKASWEKKVQTRVDDLKAKCSKQQVAYSIKVDNHVNQIIKDVQQDAFDSFMKQIPTLKGKLEELTKFEELSKHQPLLDAYNAINGLVKFEACQALDQLNTILEDVNPDVGAETDEFYKKIAELKSELDKDSEENKFIAANLPNLTKAMINLNSNYYDNKLKALSTLTDKATPEQRNKAFEEYNTAEKNMLQAWDNNSKQIENLLSPEALNNAKTIPLAGEWAIKMKGQKSNLIKSVDSIMVLRVDGNGNTVGYSKKRYGFFQDRVDEAKKIAEFQQKDLKKLDVSFANYLSDSTSELWAPLSKGLANAKANTILRNKKNLEATEEDLTKYTDVKDVKNLNKNKALYEKNQQIYEKYWKPLEGLDKKIVSEKASVAKLTKRINKDYSKDNANKLAALYADSAEKRKEINIELVSFAVKHGFETLGLATEKEKGKALKPFGVKNDSNLAYCGKIITECDEAIKALANLSNSINYLQKDMKDPITLDDYSSDAKPVTLEEAQLRIKEWTKFYTLARTNAGKRAGNLNKEIELQSIAAAIEQASGAAEDKEFLDNLLLNFDLVRTNDDGNCFFHAIKAGLELQVDPRFDIFKTMNPEALRVELYNHIKANPDDYVMNIANSLSNDIVSFAKAAFDEVDVLFLQKAPALQPLYVEFRNKYQSLSSDKKDELEEELHTSYCNAETVHLYADAMANEKTYVDLTEALAMKNMLNIRIDLHSQVLGRDDGLLQGADELPVMHILRPKNKAHFELLVEKKPVVAVSNPEEAKVIPVVEKKLEETT